MNKHKQERKEEGRTREMRERKRERRGGEREEKSWRGREKVRVTERKSVRGGGEGGRNKRGKMMRKN